MEFIKLALLQLAPGGACFGVTMLVMILFIGWLIQLALVYRGQYTKRYKLTFYKKTIAYIIGAGYTIWWIYDKFKN